MDTPHRPKRLKLISCEIFFREMCLAASRSRNIVDIDFLPKGLHDVGTIKMKRELQQALDRVDESRYDAIVLGYGLCNNGLIGLTAKTIPLVLPRAHDCITLFLGSKERYQEYFFSHPGVYFKTTGWIERGEGNGETNQLSIGLPFGYDQTYAEWVEKYGVENAQFLLNEIGNLAKNYTQATFIEMGVEVDSRFEDTARAEAEKRGWAFEKLQGDLSLIQRLLDGEWNPADFQQVPPGHKIVPTFHNDIVTVEKDQHE